MTKIQQQLLTLEVSKANILQQIHNACTEQFPDVTFKDVDGQVAQFIIGSRVYKNYVWELRPTYKEICSLDNIDYMTDEDIVSLVRDRSVDTSAQAQRVVNWLHTNIFYTKDMDL